MSEMLEKARKYEFIQGQQIKEEERPAFHITPYVGWMNDPNGFSYYKGEYHLFYQYNPYSTHWDSMHWGHVVSKDLLHWNYVPTALAPDEDYDKIGCFSGSAIELEDGKQLLLYTAVGQETMEDGTVRDIQTQAVAVGDGKDYKKYEKNPVITGEDVPAGGSKVDFRDPKIWKDEDGFYYAVVANMTDDGNSRILLFKSADAFQWQYVCVLDHSDEKLGKMWECPDFYEVDGKRVLVVSPMAMMPEGLKFHVGHSVIYLTGTYDKKTHQFIREDVQPLDSGIDFYAPQSMQTPDGRRVMIAWMKSWDACVVPDTQDWQGMMTLPRELEVKDGQIWQQPVRELAQYHKNPCHYEHAEIDGETALSGICGRTMDLTITMDEQDFNVFSIQLAADEEYETSFTYYKGTGILEIDRTYCGVTKDVVCVRKIKIADPKGLKKMRFILDRQSIELFINDGQQVATTAVCTPLEAEGIRFFSDKKMYITVEKYDIVL